MRVVLVSFSVKGACGQYAGSLASALAKHAEVTWLVPEHFNKRNVSGDVSLIFFRTGKKKWKAGFRLMNPFYFQPFVELILAKEPDVVHLVFGDYPWAWRLARRLQKQGIPFVVTAHDIIAHSGSVIEWVTKYFARRFIWPNATIVHIHSKKFIALAEKVGIEKNHVFVIPHGSFAHYFLPYSLYLIYLILLKFLL